MRGSSFTAQVSGGSLGGWVDGEGAPVLLLHGGPGLSYGYVDDIAADIGDGFAIAAFQQRGIAPSMTDGPYDVDTHLADVTAVLDALGWAKATVVGHSWGGHLAFHVAVAIPDRLTGVLSLDPLGGVGDGGAELFGEEMIGRLPAAIQERARELDERSMAGEATADEGYEALRLVWPSYYARPSEAPPMPDDIVLSRSALAGGFASLVERLPALEAALPSVTVPVGIVMGGDSPMPLEEAGRRTAERIPGAWLEVVEGAGHFPWYERPGCVRSALLRLGA